MAEQQSGSRTSGLYYPAFLDLREKGCLVIGGGRVAARKALSLVQAGGRVVVVSPEFCPALTRMMAVRRVARRFRATDLRDAAVVVCATNDPPTNERAARLAVQRGIPVNVVDVPRLCTFIVPSVVRRGPITIAISTGGATPAVAKEIRAKIESVLPPRYAAFVTALGRIRRELLASGLSAARRRQVLLVLATDAGHEAFCRGRMNGLRELAGLRHGRAAARRLSGKTRP